MSTSLRLPPRPRFAVYAVARIGDTLLTTPIIRAIKETYPDSHVTVHAHPKRMVLLHHLPFIDRLRPLTGKRAWLYGWLGPRRYDLALAYGHDPAIIRLALRQSRAVVAFAQSEPSLKRALAVEVPVPAERSTHAVLERLLLAAPAGISTTHYLPAYHITASERARADRILAAMADTPRRWIALQPASFPTKPYRNWPPGHFVTLARRLLEIFPDGHFLVFGGSDDVRLARDIAQGIGRPATAIAGRYGLRDSAALLARMSLYIGVDTGLTHLAGALGIPTVAIYHCLHPGKNLAPLSAPAPFIVIQHTPRSAICTAQESLDSITPDQVMAHLQRHPDLLRQAECRT